MRILNQMLLHTNEKRSVYSLGFVLFFWTLFDGLVSYATPILITDNGFSNTMMGLIISTSSIFGIVFDVFLASILKKVNHRRILLLVLIISLLYPVILWSATTIFFYILCMAVWGLYYDLYSFGIGDFTGRAGDYSTNSENVSILSVFKSCGYLIAPILTSVIIGSFIAPQYYAMFFVVVSLFLFMIFLSVSKNDKSISPPDGEIKHKPILSQLKVWLKVTKQLLPALLFTFMIYVFDAITWTLGPMLSETFPEFSNFGGFYVMVSMLPGLTMAFLAPKIIKRFGKKYTAFVCFGLSNLILIPMLIINQPLLVLILTFASSLVGFISFPAIHSAFSDYIAESKTMDREILGLSDVFVNLGYIIGPALIGFLSDQLGSIQSIAFMAIIGIISSVIFIIATPKKLVVSE